MFGVCSSVLHICLKTFTHRCLVAQNRFRRFCIRICGLLFLAPCCRSHCVCPPASDLIFFNSGTFSNILRYIALSAVELAAKKEGFGLVYLVVRSKFHNWKSQVVLYTIRYDRRV